MRCYHFCNMYLASIQHGIQSAHAQMELFVKYSDPQCPHYLELYTWAQYHKTMICLNGGMHVNMKSLLEHVSSPDNPHSWSCFYEDDDAVNGLLTNVAVVLPGYFYDNVPQVMLSQTTNDLVLLASASAGWTPWHFKMAELMHKLRLAQ